MQPTIIRTVAKQVIHNQLGKTIEIIILIPIAIQISPIKCFVHLLIGFTPIFFIYLMYSKKLEMIQKKSYIIFI
jgi:hypothetical protein